MYLIQVIFVTSPVTCSLQVWCSSILISRGDKPAYLFGTRRLNTMFARTRHGILSCATCIQSSYHYDLFQYYPICS